MNEYSDYTYPHFDFAYIHPFPSDTIDLSYVDDLSWFFPDLHCVYSSLSHIIAYRIMFDYFVDY
jgi:hypothetical protein